MNLLPSIIAAFSARTETVKVAALNASCDVKRELVK